MGAEGGGAGVKQQGADAVADGGSTGLTEEDEVAGIPGLGSETWGTRDVVMAVFFEPCGQTIDLGGFTGTVETFEGDKETARHGLSLPP